jgi:flagellar protein FliO/FliZ
MESSLYIKAVLSLLFVLSLLGVVAVVLRRTGLMTNMPARISNTEKTLAVTESLTLDMKHRLLHIQSPQKNYLVIVGGARPVVVDVVERVPVDAVQEQ